MDLKTAGIMFGILVGVMAIWEFGLKRWRERSTLQQGRLGDRESMLLKLIGDFPGRYAYLSRGLDRPEHVVVGDRVLLEKDNELARLEWIESLQSLENRGYVETNNDRYYKITAAGLRAYER